MRIGLHAGTLRGFGSSTIGRSLVRALFDCRQEHRFEAWIPREWEWTGSSFGSAVTLHETERGLLHKLVTENVQIRRRLGRGRVDVLFSLGDTSLPRCRVPHLLLVQQAYLAYPRESLEFPISARFRARINAMSIYLRLALPSVTWITVQSEHMKRMFAQRYSYPSERISVIPSSVDLAIDPAPGHELRLAKPYICYVASASPHKNHAVLAEVMSALEGRYPDLHCRLTVDPAQVADLVDRARKLGVTHRFIFEGAVSHRRAAVLLQAARALVMPSLLESFGLPYYEAMAVGCPVIAADRPCAREACASAALYADPHSGAEIAHQIERLIDSDSLRDECVRTGLARFAEFDRPWSETAAEYLALLDHVRDCES